MLRVRWRFNRQLRGGTDSTTTALSPSLTMLRSIASMNRKYLPSEPKSEAFVSFVESLDESQWNQLVENVPEAIATRNPVHFGQFDEISPSDLNAVLQDA